MKNNVVTVASGAPWLCVGTAAEVVGAELFGAVIAMSSVPEPREISRNCRHHSIGGTAIGAFSFSSGRILPLKNRFFRLDGLLRHTGLVSDLC